MLSLEKHKQLKISLLKFNIDKMLKSNHDWKVARAISTDNPLEEEVKQYRATLVADYNERVNKITQATTKEQLDAISLIF